MKTKLTALIFMLSCNGIIAQKKLFTDCHSATRYFARQGEEIIFRCDSILLLNPQAYHTLDSAYHQLHCISLSANHKADSVNNYYQQLYAMKSAQAEQWQKSFAALRDSAMMQTQKANNTLLTVNNTIVSSKMNLAEADSLTVTSIENTKRLARNQRKQKVRSGLVGFGLGILLITITKSL